MSESLRVFYAQDSAVGIEFPSGQVVIQWRGDTAIVLHTSMREFMDATGYESDDIEFIDLRAPGEEVVTEPGLTEYTCCRAALPGPLPAGLAEKFERESSWNLVAQPVSGSASLPLQVISSTDNSCKKRAENWPMIGPPNVYPPTGSAEWLETGGAPVKTSQEFNHDCCA